MSQRREFLIGAGGVVAGFFAAGFAGCDEPKDATSGALPKGKIKDVLIEKDCVQIESEEGMVGRFALRGGPRQCLEPMAEKVRGMLVGKEVFQSDLDGEMLWEGVYPGKAKLYAEGRDPLTGEVIANKPRPGNARHTKTGEVFQAFSSVDIALWDLRGKLMKKPVYQIIGKIGNAGNSATSGRERILVYWRPGEPKNLDDARKRGRDAYDQGYRTQKWYFLNGPKEGAKGMKENVELVRVLREELGADAKLMFDNHNMRHLDDVEYAVSLAKALLPYKIFWLEEPVCPEHVEGYARIKGETGIPLAGGEHLYTRWPVKAFLERKCLDFVQCDPTWCGGISEWLKICAMAKEYPGVKVVPHITSPWTAAPQCVASQPEALCPICEYNSEGGAGALAKRMSRDQASGEMMMTMPAEAGVV
ncbi:MAG: hypothetical protein NTX50_14720 [Candidatus Sumerlaeota bacterium]|nr:hypothetical protein [Candidatus Sumerlaeota bacterium]